MPQEPNSTPVPEDTERAASFPAAPQSAGDDEFRELLATAAAEAHRQAQEREEAARNTQHNAAKEDLDNEEEVRRRAGRGGGAGGMPNPAHATHSFNIRPDVVSSPAGLEVITTMKSADYRVQQPTPDGAPVSREQPNDAKELTAEERQAAMFAEIRAERDGKAGTARGDSGQANDNSDRNAVMAPGLSAMLDEPDPRAVQQEEIIARASEESAKRQEAERAARSGEEPPGDAKTLTAEERQAGLFAAIRAEREATKGDARDDSGSREQGGEDRASPGMGGGRGVF